MIMMSKIIIWCFVAVFCLSLCVCPASAGAITDAFAGGVEDGLNGWIVAMCDSVYALGTDETNITNIDPVSHGIFRTATYTYNPFDNMGVKRVLPRFMRHVR